MHTSDPTGLPFAFLPCTCLSSGAPAIAPSVGPLEPTCPAPRPFRTCAVLAVFYPHPPHWGYWDPRELAHGDPAVHATRRTCEGDGPLEPPPAPRRTRGPSRRRGPRCKR